MANHNAGFACNSMDFHTILRCLVIALLILQFGVRPAFGQVNNKMQARGRAGQIFTEKEILDMLLENHDSKVRPKANVNGTGLFKLLCLGIAQPVSVQVNLLIRSITKVDDEKMEYSTQLTFRHSWNDDRLAYDDGGYHKYLAMPDPDKTWSPDLFFQNERYGFYHTILAPNRLTRIFPNGDVQSSIRISVAFACPMNLQLYPMDRQVCEIRMASYAFTTDDLELVWAKINHPVQMPEGGISMPRFELAGVRTDTCHSVTTTGSYSCLKVMLFFQRSLGTYMRKFYLPTGLILIISWISFWLHPQAIHGRGLLCFAMLFCMLYVVWDVNTSLPGVNYTKASDVWLAMCFVFIFASLIENAVVNHFQPADQHFQRELRGHGYELLAGPVVTGLSSQPDAIQKSDATAVRRQPGSSFLTFPSTVASKVDYVSRFAFPCAFVLFNIIYWAGYKGNVPDWPN